MRKRIIITGATSGIGLETLRTLANEKYEIILACRNIKKTEDIVDRIVAQNKNTCLHIHHLDLSSFKSIQSFSKSIHDNYDFIDILFNNAGIFSEAKKKTEEGFEITLGVNFIGTYYLTALLKDIVAKGTEPQIINVCSRAALFGRFKYKEGRFEHHPHGFFAYSASKYLQLLTTKYMAKEFDQAGISLSLIHPGDVATNIWIGESLIMKIVGPIMKKNLLSLAEGAVAGLYLIENRPDASGGFYKMRGEAIEFKKYDEDKAKFIIDKIDEIIEYKNMSLNK